MKTLSPLVPLRHAVAESLKRIANSQPEKSHTTSDRSLRFESLEERRVLSVNIPVGDSGFVTSDHDAQNFSLQEDEVTRLVVLVNGDRHELTPQNNHLKLTAGDSLEVTEIGFSTDEKTGVFAVEGYLNKINDLTSASLIDYNDGRFSDPSRDYTADGSDGVVAGLNKAWTIESGWDRLTISLMHYTEKATEVSARFFVHMQVGQPDFEFDTKFLDTVKDLPNKVGSEIEIPARWTNAQEGIFHNYAEVDIYHADNPESIVWAGASVGNASHENQVEGEFVNTRQNDGFSHRWTPEAHGEYILKYTLDPEHVVEESNEFNNTYEIRINVEPQKHLTAPATVSGDEDTAIELNISSDHDTVEISGVPKHASLNQGEHVGDGVYRLSNDQLNGLSVTPAEHSDADFRLTITPIDGEHRLDALSTTVDVVVFAVVDGGNVKFRDFGIQTGHTGKVPVASEFFDRDGSESHEIKITGLPEYLRFNRGQRDGATWTFDSKELDGLRIKALHVEDTSDWNRYRGRYVFTTIDIDVTLESVEENDAERQIRKSQFEITIWQRRTHKHR